MSEKEEVLQQISDIKTHLVDKESFFPYNYNAIYVWSTIATVLTLFAVYVYERDIWLGTAFVTTLILFGIVVEALLTKEVNKNYNIEECTKKQQFFVKSCGMLSSFVVLFSLILASYQLHASILILWLFTASFIYFVLGYVSNISRFMKLARFNILVVLALLLYGFFNEIVIGTDTPFFMLVQGCLIVCLAILPSIAAYKQLKG